MKAEEHTPERRSKAFREAVEINNLSYKDVTKICNSNDSTVFKWLNGQLVPTVGAVLMLHAAIMAARKVMPRELNRVFSHIRRGCDRWAMDNKEKGRVSYHGEKVTEPNKMKPVRFFMYRGERLSMPEIGVRSGLSYACTYQRIVVQANLNDGDVVTPVIDKPGRARRRSAE